jgi:hypothetical protein
MIDEAGSVAKFGPRQLSDQTVRKRRFRKIGKKNILCGFKSLDIFPSHGPEKPKKGLESSKVGPVVPSNRI